MRHLHRIVAACTLGDAQVSEAEDRIASPLEAVRNNEALWIFGADRLHKAPNDTDVGFFRHFGGLIEQIEAESVAWNSFVALAEHAPLESAGVEGLFIRPQIEGFFGRIDAITRSSMEVEIDMDSVFAAELDGLVDIFEFIFTADFAQVAGIGPTKVRHWQAGEIKSPFRNHREIAFLERRVSIMPFDAFFGQVESAPTRQVLGGWFFPFSLPEG